MHHQENAHEAGHGTVHDDGAVHAHVSHWLFYLVIFGALLFFTALTVGQSYVDLGQFNLLAVIVIASMKASLVVLFFMHLRYDNKFHGLAFVCGLLFIGVFFVYTMNDTERRGELDPAASMPLLPQTGEPAPGGFDEKETLEKRAKMVESRAHGGGHETHGEPAAPAPMPSAHP